MQLLEAKVGTGIIITLLGGCLTCGYIWGPEQMFSEFTTVLMGIAGFLVVKRGAEQPKTVVRGAGGDPTGEATK